MIKRAFLVDNTLAGKRIDLNQLEDKNTGRGSRLDKISLIGGNNNVVLVGTRQVNIDPEEDSSTVIMISNAMDPNELQNSSTFFEISSDFERQLSRFGEVSSIKILRKSEGYSTAGNVSTIQG